MKLLTLHRRTAYIQYKQTICSWSAVFVLLSFILTILLPFYIAFYLFNDIWSQYKIAYEHPDVKFRYKYIFVAEHSAISAENGDSVDLSSTTCTSYGFLNKIFDDQLDCGTIKFWEKDSDFDKRSDRLTFQLAFQSPRGFVMKNFHLFMEFTAKLNRQCNLQIPAALILQQSQVPSNFRGGEINIEAELSLVQRTGFYCPFFMRQIKSHFYHTLIADNSTNVRDYELASIRKRLQNNPAYMSNDRWTTIEWKQEPSNNVILNLDLKIDETISRYHTSYWQRLGQIWIHYFSIFLVCEYLAEKLKHYIFSKQIMRSWEIIPWKKIY